MSVATQLKTICLLVVGLSVALAVGASFQQIPPTPDKCGTQAKVQEALDAELLCTPYMSYRAKGGSLVPKMEAHCHRQRLIVRKYELCKISTD